MRMSSVHNRRPRSTFSVDSPLQTVAWVSLVAVLCYLAAKLGGAVVMRPQVDWPLWPGNVLLVSILLLLPRRIWPILMAAGFVAFALYDLQSGVTIRSTALLILSDFVEVLVAAWGLSYVFGEVPQLDSVKSLAKFVCVAVVLAPFTAAFFGALASHGSYWTSWRISFLSEALAFLTLLPAILGWVSKRASWARESLAYHLEAGALLVALVLVGYLTFVSPWAIVVPALGRFALRPNRCQYCNGCFGFSVDLGSNQWPRSIRRNGTVQERHVATGVLIVCHCTVHGSGSPGGGAQT
jgi:integral membrane sensor domain MASE1